MAVVFSGLSVALTPRNSFAPLVFCNHPLFANIYTSKLSCGFVAQQQMLRIPAVLGSTACLYEVFYSARIVAQTLAARLHTPSANSCNHPCCYLRCGGQLFSADDQGIQMMVFALSVSCELLEVCQCTRCARLHYRMTYMYLARCRQFSWCDIRSLGWRVH